MLYVCFGSKAYLFWPFWPNMLQSQRKKRSQRSLFSLASPTYFMDNRDTQYILLVFCQRNFSKIWHFRCEFDVEKENLFWQQNILFVIFLFICMMYLLLSIKSRLLTIFYKYIHFTYITGIAVNIVCHFIFNFWLKITV